MPSEPASLWAMLRASRRVGSSSWPEAAAAPNWSRRSRRWRMVGRFFCQSWSRSSSIWSKALPFLLSLVRPGEVFFIGWWRLVLPAEDFGDLLGEGEGVEGFEEDAGEAEAGEAALIDTLDFGGEQKNGNPVNRGVFLHRFERGRAVDSGHHDVH